MCLLSCDTKPTGSSSLRPDCGLADVLPFSLPEMMKVWCPASAAPVWWPLHKSRHGSIVYTGHAHKVASVWRAIAVIALFHPVSATVESVWPTTVAVRGVPAV